MELIVIGVAAIGGWGVVAAIAVSIASIAYSLSVANKSQSSSQQERKQMLRSGAAACNVLYGKNRSSGVLTFAEEACIFKEGYQGEYRSDEEWLYLVATHASHPLHKVDNYKLNDENIRDINSGLWVAQTYLVGTNTANAELVKTCPSWKDDMIGKGISWFWLRLKFDQNAFPQGVPNINAEKWGWEILDPRSNQTGWTDNPIICILHYLKHYMKYTDDELIMESFISAANVCDEWITLPNEAGQEKRYTLGAEFELSENPADILDKMKAACGGEWIKVGGRLGITVAAYYGPAVIEITEDDIIGDIELQPEVERQDAINTIRGKFNDASQDYVETDFPQVSVKEYVTEDGEEIIEDMDLPFVQSPWQCQRLAHITIMRNRYGMTLKLPCNLRGFKAVAGSVIKVKLAGLGMDSMEFRVLDWEFSLDNGVVLVVRRELASMYDDDAVGKPMEVPPFITGNNKPAAPADLRFDVETVNDTTNGKLYWQNKTLQLAHTVIKVKNGAVLLQAIQVPSPAESVNLVGLSAGNYSIEAHAVSVSGTMSPVVAISINLAAPTAPSGIQFETDNFSVTARPALAAPQSLGTQYDWWFGLTEAEVRNKTFPKGRGFILTQQGLRPDTQYWYGVEAVNMLGRSSLTVGNCRTKLDASDLLEVVGPQLPSLEWANGLDQLVQENTSQIVLMKDKAALAVNKDGRVSGITVTAGAESSVVDFLADYVAFTDPDTLERKLYWDNLQKVLTLKGRMVLNDGTTISNVEDIKGQNGTSGAGFYRLVNETGNWPGDSVANSLFNSSYGRYPVKDDVLTFFSTSGATGATKRCSSSNAGTNAAWVDAAMVIHGDMIARGTIAGDRIVAGSISADKLTVGVSSDNHIWNSSGLDRLGHKTTEGWFTGDGMSVEAVTEAASWLNKDNLKFTIIDTALNKWSHFDASTRIPCNGGERWHFSCRGRGDSHFRIQFEVHKSDGVVEYLFLNNVVDGGDANSVRTTEFNMPERAIWTRLVVVAAEGIATGASMTIGQITYKKQSGSVDIANGAITSDKIVAKVLLESPHIRTAASGSRIELKDDRMEVWDGSKLRVVLGSL